MVLVWYWYGMVCIYVWYVWLYTWSHGYNVLTSGIYGIIPSQWSKWPTFLGVSKSHVFGVIHSQQALSKNRLLQIHHFYWRSVPQFLAHQNLCDTHMYLKVYVSYDIYYIYWYIDIYYKVYPMIYTIYIYIHLYIYPEKMRPNPVWSQTPLTESFTTASPEP
jgi:hypothetical protein